jgi:hypothetical protein
MMDDPRLAPIRRYNNNVSAVWAWVAAASALLLIGFIIVASFNTSNTASNGSSSPTTASRTATPPSTEGSGSRPDRMCLWVTEQLRRHHPVTHDAAHCT